MTKPYPGPGEGALASISLGCEVGGSVDRFGLCCFCNPFIDFYDNIIWQIVLPYKLVEVSLNFGSHIVGRFTSGAPPRNQYLGECLLVGIWVRLQHQKAVVDCLTC